MLAVTTQICQFAVAKSTYSQMFNKSVTIQQCGKGIVYYFPIFLVAMALTVETIMV